MYDYLIVGSGLFGSVCARELTDKGYRCLVIDKKSHIGGHCYSEKTDNINVHKYGPHIFHTSNKKVWTYINRFVEFNHFSYRPKVSYKNKLYSFPINLLTLYQIFGVKTPAEAKQKLEKVRVKNDDPRNLEEYIVSLVGIELYEIFIKGYTTKQWQRDPTDLPVSIIKRIPIRLTFDDNYYFDKYQGIPIGGYTSIFERMLEGIEVLLDVDYFKNRSYWNSVARKIIYTGLIDEFYDYKCGNLEYLSLRFDYRFYKNTDYQGNAAINYTDLSIPYTRIVEHKHFEYKDCPNTVITTEYPEAWNKNKDPYYPINNESNNKIYQEYKMLSDLNKNVIFGGRLAEYKYYDMHTIIDRALTLTETL